MICAGFTLALFANTIELNIYIYLIIEGIDVFLNDETFDLAQGDNNL
jgi:predicted peroxiredoxin